MKFTKPKPNDTYTITAVPEWPSIVFETDTTGPHTWHWTVAWGGFKKSGTETTAGNTWDARAVIWNYGGTLTVRAEANRASATIKVKVKGTNPNPIDVGQYLARQANSAGFDKIIEHESRFRHFNKANEPVKSFDNGYGMCQLTIPVPTFGQVWNWQLNIDAGLRLFDQKRAEASAHLSQSGRTFTAEQLKYEAVCRWNGGSYHEWDAAANQWVRKTNILCDSRTGNIGWDMNNAANTGKTEAELHKRDSGSYKKPRTRGAPWRYFGVCYADRILAATPQETAAEAVQAVVAEAAHVAAALAALAAAALGARSGYKDGWRPDQGFGR